MQMAEGWLRTWICLSLLFAWARAARPRFDVSTDMGMVLVPADAEVDSAIFRLRATDQDADFPLVFEIIATTSPIVRVENLPCTLYNKVCQANVILTRRLVPGRLHDFVVRVRDSKGDVNSMQATISVTNSTTPRDKIFPHIPSLIMVPEDTKPEKELDYLLVESNPWSGKPVYIELWQPKELFKIRQRQMGSQTKGIITLIGELDFETQSMYTLTMYATDPYTEPGKDTRNIAGLHVVVVVQDVQDVPPVFTLAPPLTKINNTVKPGDVILRVHAEDGDKGVPREVTYGLISEGNPFTPFFNVSETTGEIILARPLEELTKITHVGAPIILKIVAEEIRTSRDEPPAQATIVELGLLLGEPGNSPPYFENDNYVAWMDENAEPGTIVMFTDAYSTRVKDEDIGKAGVFALKLENNNGTFEISPAVAERTANFVITVRDNSLIDYEKFKSLRFKIVAQEVGPATNLSASVPVTIFLRDINDNPPIFDVPVYEVTLSENASAGTKVVQVHATDNDAGVFGRIQYVRIIGVGSEAFEMNPDNGLITVSMGSVLDREQTSRLELTVEARDEDGRGLRSIATLIVNILDVNDNAPVFEKGIYEFLLNAELTNFTMPAFIKAVDIDSEPPNNVVRYEIVHGNYDNKFQLNAETGELTLREAINKARKIRQNHRGNLTLNMRKQFRISDTEVLKNQTNVTTTSNSTESTFGDFHLLNNLTEADVDIKNQSRRRRAEDTPLFLLTARAYDLGVPHLSNIAQIRIMRPMSPFARIVMFVMPGENPDPKKTAETLATITGSRVTIQEIKPYVPQINIENNNDLGKRSVVVAKVEQNGPGTLVDVEKIRESLAANGFGIISGMDGVGGDTSASPGSDINPNNSNSGRSNSKNISVIGTSSEEVTVYKAENKLLTWLLVLLGLLLLAAIITLIVCCICPSCPFYMEPRKRRIHSSETLVIRSDGRPKRHLHRKPIKVIDGYIERKEAWSADPARQHWQFNRRNTKNLAIASLPGDIVPGHQNTEIERLRRAASLRLHDQRSAEPAVFGEHVIHQTRVIPMPAEDERIYMEDVEAQNRNYEQAEIDSLRRHELERGSDGVLRNGTIAAAVVGGNRESVREQHFYRDGNAEVLRLVTRGEVEDRKEFADRANELYHANGKDILLQRFIEDQKLRRSQDLRESFHESLHEADIDRSMEMHQRINNGPAEILIIPERLELQRQPSYNQRQHQQEQMLNADIQRLIVERNYKSKDEEADEHRSTEALRATMRDAETEAGEASRSVGNASGRDRNASCTMHDVDVELVRQNALLTRLLLEKEGRGLNVPLVDSSSFLETQSLPGQVAIATQTDRTAATQTEFFTRSRSDNEEAEEDPRIRRKSKLKGRLEAKEDFQKMKTIWVRTPIPEESRAQSGNKKVTPKRTQIEVTESRKVSISPDVLKEISNSCKSGESDGNKEDEEDEAFEQETEIKSDKTQQARKLTTKTVCTSKKKVKETRVDDDSTTPSPETKDKSNLIKSKVRKKIEKPPRKKLEKSSDSEKSHFMEPSFRVLEREINSFQQKIRQFGDKKLKMLKKDDSSSSSKKEKESKDNDSAVYDVSKKCEVTVKRSKKSVSRETSPTKISVEQKTKTSEESSSAKEKTTNQHQSNISSSDIEDFDKPKKQPSTNFSERTTQYEISKTQTRSRSKLRRQTNLENSDTKSSREKIEKYEDSERTKDSTSSMEIKLDSNSSSSIESVKQHESMDTHKVQKPQEKKILQSQRVAMKAKPTRMVDIKRKITSLKSKTVEEPSKRVSKKDEKANKTKSLTSDDSKSTSPSKSRESVQNTKLTTSEEEKSNRDAISSKSKESMAIDFEKLVKDVRGAVEKEISSLTQAAKDAISISKSGSVGKNDEKQQTPNRTNSSIGKNSNKIMDGSKQEAGMKKTNENERMKKATESKEKREKMSDQKENAKSIECSSSSQSKSDEAISFIVIENKGSIMSLVEQNKKCEEPTTSSQSISKMDKDKKDEKLKRKDNGFTSDIETNAVDDKSKRLLEKSSESKAARMVSDEIDETKKMISSKIDETKKNVSDEINETKKIVSDHIDETQKSISDKINETKKIMSDKIDETNKSVSDTIDQTKKVVSDKIDETKQSISNKIDQSKTDATEDVDKTKKPISDKIHESIVKLDKDVKIGDMEQKTLKDKIDISAVNTHVSTDRNKNLSDEIGVVEKSISDKIDNTEKKLAKEINKTSKNVSDTINESKKIVSTEIDKSLSKIDNTIEKNDAKVEENIKISSTDDSVKTDSIHHSSDEIKETKNNVSDQIKESSKTAMDAIQKTSEKISSEINKTETKVSEVIDETKVKVSEVIQETKKAVIDKIDKSTDKLDENSKINAKQMSMEKQSNMLLDKKSKVDTTIVNAKSKTSSTLEDTESIGTDNVLLKSKSSSLPYETIVEDKKKAQEPQNEMNQAKVDNEFATIITTSKIKEITNELLEIEKTNASTQQQQEGEQIAPEKSITGLSGTSKEKESTIETAQMKQTKETKIHEEERLNKEDSASTGDSNKAKETSSTEMTQLKQMKETEMQRVQRADKKEFTSTSSDQTQETTQEVSQLKQAQGQANTANRMVSTSDGKVVSSPSNTENKVKSASSKEENKTAIKLLPARAAAAAAAADHLNKPIVKVTNATTDEAEDESDEDDSSSASDISNKTALRTRPYSTPRHSISSDGGGTGDIVVVETPRLEKSADDVKSSGKPRQKWSTGKERDPPLKVEAHQQPRDFSKAVFPQKIEVSPMDKPKISMAKAASDQTKAQKSPTKETRTTSTTTKSIGHADGKTSEVTESRHRSESSRTRPVVVSVKKKEHHSRSDHFTRHAAETRKNPSPRREKETTKSEDKRSQQQSQSEQRKVEIRSKHLKLHVSHHYRQPKDEAAAAGGSPKEDKSSGKASEPSRIPSPRREKDAAAAATTTTGESHTTANATGRIIDYGKDPEIDNARSRYMAWYQQKRTEMERKRRERKEAEEEQQRPKWMKRPVPPGKSRKAKSANDGDQLTADTKQSSRPRERAKSSSDAAQSTPKMGRLRIKPLVNVESEQLKAIVRQGRKLRKAEGTRPEDPPVQIFALEKPSQPPVDPLATTMHLEPRHHLTQHSEYKYEKTVPTMPFYLHPPPPVPHPSPEHFQDDSSDSRRLDDDLDSGIAVSLQGGGTRLRHQQLLEKKSVFDIAYNEAAPTQLRSDSSTPPS